MSISKDKKKKKKACWKEMMYRCFLFFLKSVEGVIVYFYITDMVSKLEWKLVQLGNKTGRAKWDLRT